MEQDDDTDQDIGDRESDGASQDTGEYILLSDIEEEDLDHQQQVLLLGQARRDKSLQTSRVPLPMTWSHANAVIARPLITNSRKPHASMAPPLLKRQPSALLNKSCKSDHAPSTQALPQHESSGDQNAPRPKVIADQNIPQHQKAPFEVVKAFMEAIVFTKTSSLIVSDDNYLMVENVRKLVIEAQDHQPALAGALVGTPSVCQLLRGPSLKFHLQMREAVSLEFSLMPVYRIYPNDFAPKYT